MSNIKFYNASILPEADEQEDGLTRVSIVANCGSLMDFVNEAVAIDTSEGLKISTHTEKPPILANHDYNRPLGHIESITIENGVIKCNGVFSMENYETYTITKELSNGFPWQASLGFTVNAGFKFSKGEKITTRDGARSFDCTKKTILATDITVWECSIVLFGADNKTDVKLASELLNKEVEVEQETKPDTEKLNASANVDANKIDAAAAVEKVRAAEKAEVNRIKELKEVAEKYNASAEDITAAIDSGVTPESFELKVLRASYGKAPQVVKAEESAEDNSKVIEACAVIAAGYNPKGYDQKVIDKAEALRGRDFRDIFEAATPYRPNYEEQRNGAQWTAGASTYNLTSILSNCANAVLLRAFEEQDTAYRDVFKVSSVSNFKTAERYRIASDFEFKKLENGEEMKHGVLDDSKWTVKADVYGRQGELTYMDIVNGDALDVFGDIMRRFAWGAYRAIAKKCWSLFLNPTADAAGNAFYSSAHSNKATGKPLTAAALAEAVAAFITRKRGFGVDANELLGVRPELLIVPPSLKYTADLITKATTFSPVASTVSNYNPHSNYGWRVVSVTELEDATYGGGYSASTWYLAANPNKLAAFEVAFLNGQQAPTLRQGDVEIGRLGIKFDGHVDFGVSQQDWRGIYQVTAN